MSEQNLLDITERWNMIDYYPESGWKKMMFKAPINLWRLGLGPISGKIFMLITTTGRKSGLPRRTMVEFHKLDGRKYAPCAFGLKSDWYQNIKTDPHVTIQTSDGTERVLAYRVSDDEELLAVYELFKQRDPPLTHMYITSLGIQDTPEDVLANKDKVYLIGFEPTDEPAPPGQEVDLAWIWPVGLLIVLGLKVLRSLGKN
jgi:deazaflavin-dependent oxidoreductase (nitroreductase family)